MMALTWRRAEASAEAWAPSIAGVSAGLLSLIYSPSIFEFLSQEEMNVVAIYPAVFDLSAIFTAFLFTFYSFILTKTDGFIGKMKKTKAYASTVNYTLRALWGGAILTVLSLPMIIWEPQPIEHWSYGHAAVTLWAAVTMWVMVAFVRAGLLFGALATQD